MYEQLHSREYKKQESKQAIEHLLSPGLKQQLLLSYYEGKSVEQFVVLEIACFEQLFFLATLRRSAVLRTLDKTAMSSLVEMCKVQSFPAGETIQSSDFIGIVIKGCATRLHSQRIIARGSTFGEEGFACLVLGRIDHEAESKSLRPFTFFQVACLHYLDLLRLSQQNPRVSKHFRRYALRHVFLKWAHSIRQTQEEPGFFP